VTAAVDAPERVDVVIVGAGISGIGVAAHLRTRLPHLSFVVLEARDSIGGTWDLFRYPGIRSDSDLHTYGYAWKPWTDDDAIASGDKILRYLEEAVAEHDLAPHLRFGRRVARASWASARARWTVTVDGADGTSSIECAWLVAATGYYRYDHGHQPDLPGRDRYRGPVVDPQHWPPDLDVADRRIVVIGSGATAATLVPALAEQAAHVTMLQRSPTYFVSLPRQDRLANLARRLLGPARAYAWTRGKNVRTQALFYRLCRARPEMMKRLLVNGVARQLPEGYDVARHFTPAYGPWDQRVCFTPGGDIFRAIANGRASVVTDTIATFTETGILLASGQELPADIVVTATGLELEALGAMALDVDGEVVDPAERILYKACMLSGVPNLVTVIGYVNASWTLRVDLVGEWLCRCLAFMARAGDDVACPVADDPTMPTAPALDLDAGYIRRAAGRIPKQGTGPWRASTTYADDRQRLLHEPVADGVLHFSRVHARPT
jgi:cation diffusion facilitator CzcD-associated flavoprotein CzcO